MDTTEGCESIHRDHDGADIITTRADDHRVAHPRRYEVRNLDLALTPRVRLEHLPHPSEPPPPDQRATSEEAAADESHDSGHRGDRLVTRPGADQEGGGRPRVVHHVDGLALPQATSAAAADEERLGADDLAIAEPDRDRHLAAPQVLGWILDHHSGRPHPVLDQLTLLRTLRQNDGEERDQACRTDRSPPALRATQALPSSSDTRFCPRRRFGLHESNVVGDPSLDRVQPSGEDCQLRPGARWRRPLHQGCSSLTESNLELATQVRHLRPQPTVVVERIFEASPE